MMVSWTIDVGGWLFGSTMEAVHASFFDVATIRAAARRAAISPCTALRP